MHAELYLLFSPYYHDIIKSVIRSFGCLAAQYDVGVISGELVSRGANGPEVKKKPSQLLTIAQTLAQEGSGPRYDLSQRIINSSIQRTADIAARKLTAGATKKAADPEGYRKAKIQSMLAPKLKELLAARGVAVAKMLVKDMKKILIDNTDWDIDGEV
jgi:hypothetical protein